MRAFLCLTLTSLLLMTGVGTSAQDSATAEPVPGEILRELADDNTVNRGFLVTTVFTNLAGSTTAEVPGLPGVYFDPGTGTTHFDRPYCSPNG
ncbi:hypothetical protein JXA80_00375, partial [bacterium]|nr:hypothetical protein [candidate division CSSED10-310 bacterium]